MVRGVKKKERKIGAALVTGSVRSFAKGDYVAHGIHVDKLDTHKGCRPLNNTATVVVRHTNDTRPMSVHNPKHSIK